MIDFFGRAAKRKIIALERELAEVKADRDAAERELRMLTVPMTPMDIDALSRQAPTVSLYPQHSYFAGRRQ